jgi:2'-5' RNA ligase
MNRPASHSMYYVAIVCPIDINKKVQQFKQWMKDNFGCVVAMKSPAHITLIPPFWFACDREIELMKALQFFNSNPIVQKIELDGFSHFRKKVLYIQVKENILLNELKSQAEKHSENY